MSQHRSKQIPRASNVTVRVFAFLVTAFIITSLVPAHAGPKSSAKKLPVRVYEVRPSPFEDSLTTLGTIHADKEIKLGFEMGGILKTIDFEVGELVSKNQLMATLDPLEQELNLLHAKAEMRVETTGLERLQKKLENHQLLLEAGSILQSRLDEVELEVKEAEMRVESAQYQIQAREAGVEKTKLKAPMEGTVAVKHAEAGETVTANTLIATLVDLRKMVCEVDITEQEFYRVRVGAPCIITTDALVGYFFSGNVKSIPPVLTGHSRSVRIRVDINQPEEQRNLLLPGMLVHVRILLYKKDNALIVPMESVRWIKGKPFVFLVDNAVAVLRPIVIAYQGQEMVEIREGLKQGDQVIVTGSFTEDQVPVEVVETQIPFLPTAE